MFKHQRQRAVDEEDERARQRRGDDGCKAELYVNRAEIPFTLNALIALHYNLFHHTKQTEPGTRNRFHIKFKFMRGRRARRRRSQENISLIESMNVCNLVVLDTWYMGDEIEKYISHSIAERLQVMGNRLAYNISFSAPSSRFQLLVSRGNCGNKKRRCILACMQSQIHYAALFPSISVPFHESKWNIKKFRPSALGGSLRLDSDKSAFQKARGDKEMLLRKIIAYHFSPVVIIVVILHNGNKSTRVSFSRCFRRAWAGF